MGIFSSKKKTAPKKSQDEEQKDVAVAPSASLPKGGDATSYRIVLGPHVTEKAAMGNATGAYVFRVSGSANKIAIKKSIEALYKVSVRDVRVVSMPSKKRQVGRYQGERSGYKKAIISLKKGDKIDMVNS